MLRAFLAVLEVGGADGLKARIHERAIAIVELWAHR